MTRKPDFSKSPDSLLPVVVQDVHTLKVLMLGYMNEEAYEKTLAEKIVTFFSRSKKRLWTKGETSKNFLHLKSVAIDCDEDTILIKASPDGPTCHTGDDTCWQEENVGKVGFLEHLRKTLHDRRLNPSDKSYTSSLFAKGINKVAQKVGEEAVELVIEAKDDNKDLFLGEAADLMYHYLVLLEAKEIELDEVIDVLISRHK
ncbi:bifunctional phosphoribosyl-AMP cyclohydrolase/phosphoribosyl-ATP diphosphatase HisIE [Arcticibacterium luteifluviistationis]|uniref:Histidine biosynthesis bifunctional protein HisIE n=1 Tax=Arcticibacterium luteifluviistationis TaxID=1784714 RepID=A0A2Z4GFE4_9BACT|nr:bifunctional phosphoribosyl-AMP cyclohydrolase/phosphoribosyl-ATP diphosphatase HisIE [Arcticibacterium luteifluviistationis]AWV99881.1 bifunctional phosphoribosyl-AMP cyclohydrolase/phosphoribosyl-ATP diphosphatase [Arcticibacterium luteifluviistationis]